MFLATGDKTAMVIGDFCHAFDAICFVTFLILVEEFPYGFVVYFKCTRSSG